MNEDAQENEETQGPGTIADLCMRHAIVGSNQFLLFERREEKRKESEYLPPSVSVFYQASYSVSISKDHKTETFSYFVGHSSGKEFSKMGEWEKDKLRKKRIPKLTEVLWSLAQDASFFHNNDALYATYENFASEYGYDEDSRKGLEIYRACQANGNRLQKLLGREAFAELMNLVNEGIEE